MYSYRGALVKHMTLGLLCVLLTCLFGCNASITRQGYSVNDSQVNLEPCPNIIIKHKASFPADVATVLGSIKAGDSGFSTACSEAYVLGIFRKDACAIKANIINIMEETQPNLWSSCYRAKADLLRCNDKVLLADMKSDPQYAPDLVNQRSKKTAIMNAAALGAIGGVLGGAIGGAIAGGIAVAAVPSADSTDQKVAEWHLPVPADLGDNPEWRKENAELYLTAKADFDGDGENDMASILVNDKEDKIGLFVTLTSQKNASPILLESISDKQIIKKVGIQVALPDTYKTACGKGNSACKSDEPAEIQIDHPAINVFQPESANSFFAWDSKLNGFKKIVMSN